MCITEVDVVFGMQNSTEVESAVKSKKKVMASIINFWFIFIKLEKWIDVRKSHFILW